MPKIGFVGWRGMVGSVLMKRMEEEGDWDLYPDRMFFSSSRVENTPFSLPVENSYNLEKLMSCDVLVTCQGSDWTKDVYHKMMIYGWKGIFIDASSALRTNDESVIVLDPINRELIDRRLSEGCKLFVGGNCTTSLMMMALHGLFKLNLVDWVYSSTYQAASGAGAKHMDELLVQISRIGKQIVSYKLMDNECTALDLEREAMSEIRRDDFPAENFGAPLALSLIPWIDTPMLGGRTREEWKMGFETKKVLGLDDDDYSIGADSICVRVGSLRCHSQSLLVRLRTRVDIVGVSDILSSANPWVRVVRNEKEPTLSRLTPAYVSGKLDIAVGRIHYSEIGENILKVFTVGDQLLWGAAEPIRRILRIVSGNPV